MEDKHDEIEKDKDDSLSDILDQFFIEKRTVFLFGDIENGMIKKTVQQLLYLHSVKKEEITINIFSDGGDITGMFAIIDTIEFIKQDTDVCIVCVGKAYSAAAHLLTFGTKGKRKATANSTIMFHPMSYDLPIDYIDKQQNFSTYSKDEHDKLITLVSKNIGKKKKDFATMIEPGLWLTANEALRLKVIDEII